MIIYIPGLLMGVHINFYLEEDKHYFIHIYENTDP